MVVIINRAAYVEVREGVNTIFRKNKPPDHGGLTSRLLSSLGIASTGVFTVDLTKEAVRWVENMNGLDCRKPEDRDAADNYTMNLVELQKTVSRVS